MQSVAAAFDRAGTYSVTSVVVGFQLLLNLLPFLGGQACALGHARPRRWQQLADLLVFDRGAGRGRGAAVIGLLPRTVGTCSGKRLARRVGRRSSDRGEGDRRN